MLGASLSTRVSTVVGWGMLAGLVGLVIYFALRSATAPAPAMPETNRSEQIKAACSREFGADAEAAQACEFGLLTKALEDDKRALEDRYRRTARDAGL